MSFLSAVGICEAMWVLCAWPALYSSHTPRMYAVKVLFRHTSRGWILLMQPPRISTCDMLFSLRMSSLRWILNMSNTNKTCRPWVCLTRTFLIHDSISWWSFHSLGCIVTITLHSLALTFFKMHCVFILKVTNSWSILPEAVHVTIKCRSGALCCN